MDLRYLTYGGGSVLDLDVPRGRLLADCGPDPGLQPLADVAAAAAAAALSPLDFPPLTQACVPGDRVVMAVDVDVPQPEALVKGLLRTLTEHHASLDVTVLCDSPETARRIGASGCGAAVRTHEPSDADGLSYLAASRDGQPIYFNRLLLDADVVIPLGALRLDDSLGFWGLHGGLFPAFADEDAQARYRAPSSLQWQTHRRRRLQETEEAAWLLGVQFTVQVVPGRGDTVLHVLAGDAQAVARTGMPLCEQAWAAQVPARASLVVATLDGGAEQQTWENFARALFAAEQAVADDGEVVLCTDLRCQPGPALCQLALVGAAEPTGLALGRHRSDDALSASLLHQTLQRVRVYLLSGLESEQVEELGLGHVSNAAEVSNLVRQHSSCIVIRDAHRAMVRTSDSQQ